MNNSISCNNNLTFGAKLNLADFKGNKRTLNKIAKAFEEKTARYPKDTFNMGGSFQNGLYLEMTPVKGAEAILDINNKASRELSQMPADKIADKLKRIFTVLRQKQNRENQAMNLAKKMNLDNAVSKTEDTFWHIIYSRNNSLAEQALNKDSILADNFRIIA